MSAQPLNPLCIAKTTHNRSNHACMQSQAPLSTAYTPRHTPQSVLESGWYGAATGKASPFNISSRWPACG